MSESATEYSLVIDNEDRIIPCSQDRTVLRALIDGGVFLEANCGGKGTCGKCKVRVLKGQVAGVDGAQIQPNKDGTYMACQIYPQGDIAIQMKKAQVSQKGQGLDLVITSGDPLVRKVVLTPEYPTVDNHYSLQEMIRQAIGVGNKDTSILDDPALISSTTMLRRLSEVVEAQPAHITLTLLDGKVVAIEAGDTSGVLYGVAFDIGTTTVVGMLVDINEQRIVSICSKNNPQATLGADVISRIQATHDLIGGLEGLSQLIRTCLNTIISELCDAVSIKSSNIYTVTIAGNSTMAHLVLEISPSTLVRKPYAALFKYVAPLYAREIELEIHNQGKVVVLPNIASFIGSDTTAAILAVNQDIGLDPTLLVDLGTNGEMVIRAGDKLYACSTAAGPAFEGAHMRDGMRATEGAIADVKISEHGISFDVIGNTQPAGICGSGMVKAIAQLLKAGLLDASGRFRKPGVSNIPANLVQRLINQGDAWEFVLVEGKNTASGANISITQADIRQIQLVKSSICTGIEFLMKELGTQTNLKVCLAGAFGNYVDIDSAINIGMLPRVTREQVLSVGNAAGTGAVQALLSTDNLRRCFIIADKVNYIELAAQSDFQNRFLANLRFPVSGS
ncbi:ASKHA domain-containing protein [Sporomusa sp.]|uniref:ASKHA domain-containing protein n=1 Tax=Sporomusa sp. TaxID=2078658 RepID=UPI002D0B4800|nr:ASKHA domain-containing protein [Sporomusa sp.]HWR07182.1 ASKHA domain-containing protein [Sporomusa sp.]